MKLFLFTGSGLKPSTTFSKLLLVAICIFLLPVCSFNPEGISGQPVCGNNIIEGDEVCDGTALAGESCITQGFYGGTLACLADCSGFDTSGCGGYCGDGIKNGPEVCDGSDLGGATCDSLGLGGGTLACRADCSGYDASGCAGEPQCGNNIIQGDQVCDGTDLAGQTCESQGFYEGELACEDDCSAFDTSGCEGFCGDGIINGDEVCDGDDLGDETCESQGYEGGGTLVCLADCSNFSLTNCIAEPTHYKLTVTTEGEGKLKVGDIDVGVSHSDHYVENTVVTVEAIPTNGWEFTGWTGDVITTETLIEVTMDSEKWLQARFREILVPTRFVDAGNIQGGPPQNNPADWRFDVIVLDQNGDPFRNATGLVVTEKNGEGLSDHERIQSGHLAGSMNNASTDSDGKMTIYYTEFKLVEGLGAVWERTQDVIYLINGGEMVNAIAITVLRSGGLNSIIDVDALP